MTIEQTTQLVQLILNTVLMVVASGVLLALACRYQVALQKQLHRLMIDVEVTQRHRSAQLARSTRRQLRAIAQAVLVLTIACGSLVGSTVLLALRSLLPQNLLISGSLGLFAIGCGILLVGIGLLFRVLWQQGIPRLGRRGSTAVHPSTFRPTLRSSASPPRGFSRRVSQPAPPSIQPLDLSHAPSNLVVLRDRMAR